jgi:cytochrome b pre-mRNA-processing protein 3
MDLALPMSLLARLFKPQPEPREALRPLWHRLVELSRDPALYRDDGVADTVAGRFDMIAAILALVMLRLERDGHATETALLTELFVADMDAQLRETGVGDIVVGKHVGRLVAVLGGRIGALREALASGDDALLEAALERNVTMAEGRGAAALVRRLRAFAGKLQQLGNDEVLAGRIAL